jgi:ubiquinone/menaquinone biosynthesis C-methylase UbiE
MKMEFEDHFSRLARQYSIYRPRYPRRLFSFLAGIAPEKDLAWDCGTGNGQAALQLAKHFQNVYATDASQEQIAQAAGHPRIEYKVEPAENVSLPSSSVDLVTAAVAVHWFNLDRFYQEVKRVLKPAGILVVWTYHLPQIAPAVDHVIEMYTRQVLGDFWPARIRYLDEKYKTLPFPFQEFEPPHFEIRARWDLNCLAGFLSSWSAVNRYIAQYGNHPMERIWEELQTAWGEGDRKRVITWVLYFRLGRKTDV